MNADPPLGLALSGYVAAIALLVTLAPFGFAAPDRWALWWGTTPIDLLGNIAFFVPLGFVARLALSTPRVVALGATLSAAVEIAQLWLPFRYTSLWDLTANTAGAGLGALLLSAAARSLDRRMAGRIALGLPLMSAVYLTVPWLMLIALASAPTPERVWLATLPGLFGGLLLSSVWRNRLRDAGVSAGRLSVTAGLAVLAAELPALTWAPMAVLGSAALVAGGTRLGCTLAWQSSGGARRFERLTLVRCAPLLALSVAALAVWPLPEAPGPLRWAVRLTTLSDSPARAEILAVIEHVAAFTLAGYLAAEARGRTRTATLGAALVCGLGAVAIELLRAAHPAWGASVLRASLGLGAAVAGATLYQLQLRAVLRWLGRPAAR